MTFDEIAQEIRRLSHDGYMPSQAYYDAHRADGYPSYSTVRRRHGVWSSIAAQLGLKMQPKTPRRATPLFTIDEIAKEMWRLSPDGIHGPSWRHWENNSKGVFPDPKALLRDVEVSSWPQLIMQCGLKPDKRSPNRKRSVVPGDIEEEICQATQVHRAALQSARGRDGLQVCRTRQLPDGRVAYVLR